MPAAARTALRLKELEGADSMTPVRQRRGALSTLLHIYRTVSAHLFRAQERSVVAEDAWARATLDAEMHVDSSDSTFLNRLDLTRSRAIDLIRTANLPTTLVEKAMAALDHAYYAAITHVRRSDIPSNA
jgi:hypothetical protein